MSDSAGSTGHRVMDGSAGAADGRVVGWCDPGSGGLVDPLDDLATEAYRPGPRLVAFVRTRDGRCRFPGCQVAARCCDVDHVRAWPLGRTSASNLMCLCRRHHRVKQRPGWQVRLAADGSAGWVDPAGRERTTRPVDALHRVVLRARPGESTSLALPRGRSVLPDGPHSVLEFFMEHRLGDSWGAMTCRVDHRRPEFRRWRVSDAHAAAHRSRPRERPPPDGSAPPF